MIKKVYKLQEVYIPVGLPDLTFVQRKHLENSIKSWEINQHKHLLIFGASKTGKTSLWRRYIPPDDVIKIPCNSDVTIESLYCEILENLGAFFVQSETIETGKKSSILGEIKSIIPWLGVSGKIQGKMEENKSQKVQKEYYPRQILRLRQAGSGLCPVLVSKYRTSPFSSRALPGTQPNVPQDAANSAAPVNSLFAPLRGANARVDFVQRLAHTATRCEPTVGPATLP